MSPWTVMLIWLQRAYSRPLLGGSFNR